MMQMMRNIAIAGVGISLALWTVAACAGSGEFSIDDAWIAETPPGATVAAGYLELVNDGGETAEIVGAESPACERIEFHRMEMDGDIARMRQQESLTVAPGERLTLSPNGIHLMLIRPQALAAGDRVPIRFSLADGAELSIEAVVRARAEHSAHEHHAH
jgi:copper(I)-binding protein